MDCAGRPCARIKVRVLMLSRLIVGASEVAGAALSVGAVLGSVEAGAALGLELEAGVPPQATRLNARIRIRIMASALFTVLLSFY
jgi:hypothetical protein